MCTVRSLLYRMFSVQSGEEGVCPGVGVVSVQGGPGGLCQDYPLPQ